MAGGGFGAALGARESAGDISVLTVNSLQPPRSLKLFLPRLCPEKWQMHPCLHSIPRRALIPA